MSDYTITYLKTVLFAGFLTLLNTTTVLAVTPACNTTLAANPFK